MFTRIWNSISEVATIIMKSFTNTYAGVVLRLIPFVFTSSDLEKMLEKITENLNENKTSLDSKINEAHAALFQTSQIINELELELKKNVQSLESVKEDYEKFSRLAQVEKNAAAAVLENVQDTLHSGKRKERWINIVISLSTGLIIFIFGILVGPIITNFFNIGK